ncbi:MAG TPA: hypothetical protein VGC74_15885 [Stenotrophomonas sp.]|jgi:hypothetical protein
MRPFNKNPAVQSFQEFLKTYVRPPVREVLNPITTESVCPLCCDIFQPGTIPADYPFCPDCSSEGIDFEVALLADFLGRTTADDLSDLLKRWEAADGFLPAYKELKSERIRHLIALRRT